MLLRAQTLLQGHFYAEALDLLDGLDSIYPGEPRVRELTTRCLEGQTSLIPYSGSIPHVFFHSLVVDPKKAFDGDRKSRVPKYLFLSQSLSSTASCVPVDAPE